ncbi:MAG TPA: glycoside hydrolase family 28 protein [Pseudonocardiaceae bacterium]|nr:glycoside hydrolase family 28 protein [Pseudonocardiaceae bacterium]
MSDQFSRRDMLRLTAAAAGAVALSSVAGPASAATGSPDLAERIRGSVRRPVFAQRAFPITQYGAVGDGKTDCTGAFAKAIAACTAAGGGQVVVPGGTFSTGAIRLRSNVELHLTAGATVKFSTDPAAYPLVLGRWQGIELMNFSPFIYAYGEQNIGITGTGILDGQAGSSSWWPWKDKQDADWAALEAMATNNVPVAQRVFGKGHYLRPNFIAPFGCTKVLIQDVTIVNSPMWEINPVLCDSVTVRNVHVNSLGPNNDGCDPDSCDGVVISGCTFNTGDDCIAIKSGRNEDGRRVGVPSRNILIEDCTFQGGHGGVTIGSEMSGGVSDVVAQRLTMTSPALQSGLRLKTNSARGGYITNIHLSHAEVTQLATAAVLIDFNYDEGAGHDHNPVVSGIHVDNLHVGKAKQALDMAGYPNDHITDVTLTDCTFDTVTSTDTVQYVDGLVLTNVTENGKPVK